MKPTSGTELSLRVAVVVPAYRVCRQVLSVLGRIGPEVEHVFVVDDACPESSGLLVARECTDPRVKVLYHTDNQGVGGALVTGYRAALQAGCDIAVKLDGDGQMDPDFIPTLIQPIVTGEADYAKGNRFFELDSLGGMPFSRLVGNAALSFLTKLSSGYYGIFDPNNGYTAIHTKVLARLRLERLAKRYFFESDMLFHLGKLRAVVVDVPMQAHYGDEQSSLSVTKSLFTFSLGHIKNTFKRIFYSYFLRDFNPASLYLMAGILLSTFGVVYGGLRWAESVRFGAYASSGEVMIGALTFLLGVQFLLSFFLFDSQNAPTRALHTRLRAATVKKPQAETESADRFKASA